MRYEETENGFKVENENFRLNLTFLNDELELRADIAEGCRKPPKAQDVVNLLRSLPLQGRIEIEKVQTLCKAAGGGKAVAGVVVMRGQPPVDGKDGRLDIYNMPPDYGREKTAHPINALNGQAIAELLPPSPGKSGMTVTGKVIPAESGKPLTIRIGAGIRWADGNTPGSHTGKLVATTDGGIIYDAVAESLSISDTLNIEEDLSAKYPDIDFVGAVEIRGDVLQGHKVKAGKGIKIKGNVESSVIEAGGDVEIGGGAAGKGSGTIRSGGKVSLRYLDCCNVECKGNLVVRNEIVDSIVMCGGYVDVSNGSIIGGRIVALGGIEAKIIGSEIGMATMLTSGKNYLAEREIAVLREEEKSITASLEQISRKLDPYIKDARQLNRITTADREELRNMTGEFTRLSIKSKKIPDLIGEIKKTMLENANPMITAGKMIAKGVELEIGGASGIITESIGKSVTIVRNSAADGLRFINRIRLTDNAVKVERDIARAERKSL